MNFENGTYKILYLKKDSAYFPIGCLTSNSFSESSSTLDTTTRDNEGWETSIPTNQSYNISFDGLITQELLLSNVITYAEIRQFKRSRTLIEWKIEDSSGNIDYGTGHVNDLSDSADIDDFTSFSGSITGFGKPIDPISEIYNTYENRVITGRGNITSKECQISFIKQLLNL